MATSDTNANAIATKAAKNIPPIQFICHASLAASFMGPPYHAVWWDLQSKGPPQSAVSFTLGAWLYVHPARHPRACPEYPASLRPSLNRPKSGLERAIFVDTI